MMKVFWNGKLIGTVVRRKVMSNCIEIDKVTSVVTFLADEIDGEKLQEFLDSVPEKQGDLPNIYDLPEGADKDVESNRFIAFWFLKRNTVFLDGGVVQVFFGRGNSTHTNRDFTQTVNLFARFMRVKRLHTFLIRDELDDFDTVCRVKVVFGDQMERIGL